MRRAVKKQILEILDTINLAVEDMTSGKIKGDQLLDTLTQCQECAVAVGTAIEEAEGEGTKTVEEIEQFCELLYETAKDAYRPDVVKKLSKVLRRKSIDIQTSIKNNIPSILEILFLPYKASMWDSLESIWSAAAEDPDCEASVVPIPYFDKLQDGSFGKFHYEIEEYPDNVPVIDYNSYDIEKRRPDVICIHNPYDDGNVVTSVPPEYFASNLKQYTDMLVYIPYFVGINNYIAPRMCVLPGVVYADKVVVESEAVREIYEKELKKWCQEYDVHVPSGFIEKKFLALGSPKIDKVLASRRKDFTLPIKWQTLTAGKKVILYNTHIGGFTEDGEQFLKKLRSVLHHFEQRTDVVLWWRPHPLSESAIQTMNPAIFNEYKEIVAEYRAKGTGIFDDTADLHRAIVMTDAYYGDWSSLVTLYKATGKPIMIQNMEIIEEEMNEVVWNP